MNNAVSTHLFKIDYEYIRKNYLNRELWGKTWTIYKFSKIEVELSLVKIDVKELFAWLSLKVYYKGDKRRKYNPTTRSLNGWYEFDSIRVPLNNPEYNDTLFQNKIYGEVMNSIRIIEEQVISGTAPYKAELKRLDDWAEELKDKANQFLDENNVSNEEIRDAYVDSFVSEHEHDNSMLNSIKEQFKERLLTKEYLIFASYNGKEDDVKKYSDILRKGNVSKTCIRTWLQKQKDEEELAEIECPSL